MVSQKKNSKRTDEKSSSKKIDSLSKSVREEKSKKKSHEKKVSPPPKPKSKKPKQSSDGIAAELGLKSGSVIEDKNNKYCIVDIVGEGGFGAVFEVYNKQNPKQMYALKVEKRCRVHSKLKMEVAILKEIMTERQRGNLRKHEHGPHFTKIYGRGKMKDYVYIVMELVGNSLNDLKAMSSDNVLSVGSGIFTAIQCLEAIYDLHKLYFIHRDIKPANYAIGLHRKRKTVYLLDFGIARKISNKNNELKTPRDYVRFKGTVRFASRKCHKNKELSFGDDCESWFYLLLDLIVPGGLPWRLTEEKENVLKIKEECFLKKSYFPKHANYAKQFTQIINYISSLEYQNNVDYNFLYELISEAAHHCDVDLKTIKLDWE